MMWVALCRGRRHVGNTAVPVVLLPPVMFGATGAADGRSPRRVFSAERMRPTLHVEVLVTMFVAVAVAGVASVLTVVYLSMRFSGLLIRILGRSGILLLSRVAGLLLAVIAAQMLGDAVIALARLV